MPTILLPRREAPPPDDHSGLREVVIAAALLVGVLGLLVEQTFGPTLGYSLSQAADGLQLSP